MEKKKDDSVSYFLTKQEIIDKFEIDVPKGYDTYSYYNNHILEIKVFKVPVIKSKSSKKS